MSPTLVPAPASAVVRDGPAPDLAAGVRVDADPAFAAEGARLVDALGSGSAPVAIRHGDHPEEGYALRVEEDGVVIEAATAAGVFYAGRTLIQLAEAAGPTAVEIRDEPRFAYRGIMLDVARHFHPVETVCALIDRASDLKLNTLHLHLTDDQGWRLALSARPELAELASGTAVDGDPGGFYTADDYARIIAYAADRHMIVVPEIDVPGHTHAVGLAYPELAADPVIGDEVREVTAEFGGSLPVAGEPYTAIGVGFSSLRADAPGVDAFLTDVFHELAALTPGPYLHLGGDEALGTSADDYRSLVDRAARTVAATGKTPIAWHEAGAAPLPRGTIGQYWGFLAPTDGHDDRARAFVANGGRLILSPADAIYLDMKDSLDAPIGLTWANGPTSVERSYRWDPADVIPGIAEDDILGVEAALWTETVRTRADLERLLLPRLASAAEAAWSPSYGSVPARTWQSFRERVAARGSAWERDAPGFGRSPEIPWP